MKSIPMFNSTILLLAFTAVFTTTFALPTPRFPRDQPRPDGSPILSTPLLVQQEEALDIALVDGISFTFEQTVPSNSYSGI